jgi:2-dehydropantoate 2-reductase
MGERIAVLGAGALGGHVGGYLAREGHDVTLIDPWPEHVDAVNANGLSLRGMTPAEAFTVQVPAIHLTDLQREAKGPGFDIVFLSVKSYDTRWAAAMIDQYLAPGGFIVSLQNGINEETIAAEVGWPRVIGCVASKISVELCEPGKIARNIELGAGGTMVFRVGEPHGRITDRARRIAEMISVVDSSEPTTNLWGERWTKLAVNCMRNPMTAATGRGGNENDRDPYTRRLAIAIAAEAARIGRAHGYDLGKLYGMQPDDVIAAMEGSNAAMARCEDIIMEATKTRSEEHRPSMGQDIAKGRRTEIAFLNGYVVDHAKAIGLEAPINAAMVDRVTRVERGEAQASVDLVKGII